ncbi:hypothetical protein H7F33_13445 [Pedobacter sp. PAMC26386]|nr:hypothetical protein H7F33_13445 [Pedobacter sp. PAMC26386]
MKTLKPLLFLPFITLISFALSAQQPFPENDSTVLAIDSAHINHQLYTAIFKLNQTLYILNTKGDIIFQDSLLYSKNESFSSFKFIDFNNDGYKDLLMNYATNVPGIQDLILFNPKSNRFQKVIDFPDYPASVHIKGTNYYYSYHRSGCADMAWDSDLYMLQQNRIIKTGQISGSECEDSAEKNNIHIYAFQHKKRKTITVYPIKILDKYKNRKWDFIESYWKKNYSRFKT